MEEIETLRREDTRKKNTLMLTTYSVSLLAATVYTVIQNETFYKTLIYSSELLFFILFYFILQVGIKKETLYPYAALTVIFIHSFLYIGLFGGNGSFLLVLIFLSVFSAIHFDKRIFAFGYSLG